MKRSLSTVVLVALCTTISSGSDIDKKVLSRIEREGYPAWERYRGSFPNGCVVSLVSVQTLTGKDGSTVTEEGRYTAKYLGEGLAKVVHPTHDRTTCTIANPRYHFRIYRTGDDTPWILSDGDANAKTQSSPLLHVNRASTFFAGSYCLAYPLEFMLTDSSFKLLSCEESDTGLVHLELRKQGGGYDKGIFSIKLDPEFGWLVRDWSVRDQYGFVGTQHIYKNIYRSDPTATSPMIERIQIEEVANDGRRDTGTVKVELLDDTVDPDEFFSPYYGIPESAILPASKPRPWLRWILLGGGILCVLGGLWLKRGRGE